MKIKRLQLFEFEDLKWFPQFLRNYVTDILQYHLLVDKTYSPITGELKKVLKATSERKIIDLCSGSSGPWKCLIKDLVDENCIDKVILTDKYPNLKYNQNITSFDDYIEYYKASVDAEHIPDNLKGFRTFFSSFHHFKPDAALKILQNTVDNKQSIGIFEFTDRTIKNIIMMLLSPIIVFVLTPFIRPFTISRIVFTYLIPIIPIVYLWDGIVSYIRTYNVDELKALAGRVSNENYKWKTGKVYSKDSGVFITYMIGYLCADPVENE